MINIGDRIKCINVGSLVPRFGTMPPLTLNREYIAYDLTICPSCGDIGVDVGIRTEHDQYRCVCYNLHPNNGIWWCSIKRFVKVQEKTQEKVIYKSVKVDIEINKEDLQLN